MNDLTQIRDALRRFADERDWDQFHSPKNLAMALSVEAAELLEHFQWVDGEASKRPSDVDLEKIRQEMADVLLYLVRIADKLDTDLIEVAHAKIKLNESKYPVDKSRGNSKKYTEL